ncbi:MAG TPA: hypothetical protein VM925_06330 [Labilithrix sp.]|nr:hypothetical protein [Labilithrix sp.]
MNPRTLLRLLGGYAFFLVVLCVGVRSFFSLSAPANEVVVESWWRGGERIGRRVFDAKAPLTGAPPVGAGVAEEVITGEGPLFMTPLLFTLGLVPGRDGVKAEVDGKVAYATVDDLMRLQAYDRAHLWVEASFGWGTHRGSVLYVLSEQLGVRPSELASRGTFRRVRFERRRSSAPPVSSPPSTNLAEASATPSSRPERITEANLSRELVLEGVRAAATHLARSVDDDGRFRYMIDAPTNITVPSYNWPRHSGATFFLAQSAALLDDPFVRYACLRAAAHLRDNMLRSCGTNRCISEDYGLAEIGSSALALIAFTEIVRTGADGAYRPAIADLASFLRSQQRGDGEFKHQYDRASNTPIDVQFLYFSGEATLALARAHAITGDPRDLDAARRGLARLSGSGWSFFGSRYYFSEEHWTCQAVAELWERSPDEEALTFCARWHEYQRRLQQDADETPFDADGAFGFGPLVSPRVTPASSRGEAAGALLEVLVRERLKGRASGRTDSKLVERELGRALAFVLRNQFYPGPVHLFADPVAVRGAVPGSPVDWQLRIDYAQHAGSMMVRWLAIDALVTAN